MSFDISSIKARSISSAKYWLLIVDEVTDMSWSYFLKEKSDTAAKICEFVQELREKGFDVRYLRCDNAGENKKAEEALKEKGIFVQFEYTTACTLQQNGKVERKFATLDGRV